MMTLPSEVTFNWAETPKVVEANRISKNAFLISQLFNDTFLVVYLEICGKDRKRKELFQVIRVSKIIA